VKILAGRGRVKNTTPLAKRERSKRSLQPFASKGSGSIYPLEGEISAKWENEKITGGRGDWVRKKRNALLMTG